MKRAYTVALAGCALLTALSCFSDRDSVGPPTNGGGPDCIVPGSAIGANRTVVLIRNFRFLADTIRIRAGTTVTWVNCEGANIDPHTATSTTGIWDSGILPPGSAYAREFTTPGTFGYFCQPHPTMRGAVIVE